MSKSLALLALCATAMVSAAVDLPPIVLVPGIGGSLLRYRKVNDTSDEGLGRAWIQFESQESLFKEYMWGAFDEASGKFKNYRDDIEVFAPKANSGLDAISTLDPDATWPVSGYVEYFRKVIAALLAKGYLPGQTLWGAPYDWRQSNAFGPALDGLEAVLETAHNATGRKVTLVTHSMGGLLVRSLLALRAPQFAAHVENWVAIAAPWQGAGGKILSEFLSGYNLGNVLIKAASARALSVQAPTVYELLPNPFFHWQRPPFVLASVNFSVPKVFTPAADPAAAAGDSVYSLFDAVLRDFSVEFHDELRRENFSFPLLRRAMDLQRLWGAARLPDSVRFLNIYGAGRPTPLGVVYVAPVSSFSDLLAAKAEFQNVDGDETVPLESALADGFGEVPRLGVECEHMACVYQPVTLQALLCFLNLSSTNSSCAELMAAGAKRPLRAMEFVGDDALLAAYARGWGHNGAADAAPHTADALAVALADNAAADPAAALAAAAAEAESGQDEPAETPATGAPPAPAAAAASAGEEEKAPMGLDSLLKLMGSALAPDAPDTPPAAAAELGGAPLGVSLPFGELPVPDGADGPFSLPVGLLRGPGHRGMPPGVRFAEAAEPAPADADPLAGFLNAIGRAMHRRPHGPDGMPEDRPVIILRRGPGVPGAEGGMPFPLMEGPVELPPMMFGPGMGRRHEGHRRHHGMAAGGDDGFPQFFRRQFGFN